MIYSFLKLNSEKIKNKYCELDIILQIPKRAMNKIDKASEYFGLVSHFLIDPSGGTGESLEKKDLELALEVSNQLPNSVCGIAGGFSSQNVYGRCNQFASIYSNDFSIDAEGRLMSENGEDLDLKKCEKYLREYDRFILDS